MVRPMVQLMIRLMNRLMIRLMNRHEAGPVGVISTMTSLDIIIYLMIR